MDQEDPVAMRILKESKSNHVIMDRDDNPLIESEAAVREYVGQKKLHLMVWRLDRKVCSMEGKKWQVCQMSDSTQQPTFQESTKAVVSIFCLALIFVLACGGRFLICVIVCNGLLV